MLMVGERIAVCASTAGPLKYANDNSAAIKAGVKRVVQTSSVAATSTPTGSPDSVSDETRWTDIKDLLSGVGVPWNGAAFFRADRAGLVDDETARQRLSSLARHLEMDRSLLTHSEFFNAQGLRLKIEEVGTH